MKGQDRFSIGINWHKSTSFHGAESIYIKFLPGLLRTRFYCYHYNFNGYQCNNIYTICFLKLELMKGKQNKKPTFSLFIFLLSPCGENYHSKNSWVYILVLASMKNFSANMIA